jgi:nucleoside-diphosphate-sugar epimerase
VTGGEGFIGGYCILQLLAAGHRVRTTVLSLKREPEVRAALKANGAKMEDRLSFVVADLERDEGWGQAVDGCDYVLHVASPFPATLPKHEDDLIIPARGGALRVLRAARAAHVKRVVLTSSFAAIGYGHKEQAAPFDETNWTDLSAGYVSAYVKSKTLAERVAWDFVAKEGDGLELAVVNPVGVFGPLLGPNISTSISYIQRLLEGALPALPKLRFGVVDVRDVADLHLRAMTDARAKGERFLATAGDFMSLREIGLALKARMGAAARHVPTRELPDWLVRLASLVNPAIRQIAPELGKAKNATSEKARCLLGWAPRSREETLVATAESLARQGLLKVSPTFGSAVSDATYTSAYVVSYGVVYASVFIAQLLPQEYALIQGLYDGGAAARNALRGGEPTGCAERKNHNSEGLVLTAADETLLLEDGGGGRRC